jgi:DNA-directed RNA polymerase specialized sigma24 family protein
LLEVEVDSFDVFFERVEPRLREALSATLGSEAGREAAADALSYGWENWERVRFMDNPAGYLYVVGRDRGRKRLRRRRRPAFIPVDDQRSPWVEPGLPDALSGLPEQQRMGVTL